MEKVKQEKSLLQSAFPGKRFSKTLVRIELPCVFMIKGDSSLYLINQKSGTIVIKKDANIRRKCKKEGMEL